LASRFLTSQQNPPETQVKYYSFRHFKAKSFYFKPKKLYFLILTQLPKYLYIKPTNHEKLIIVVTNIFPGL